MLACVRTVADADTLLPVCTRLTPRIERHPDALVLDLTGCERLILASCPSRPVAEDGSAGAVWPLLAAAVYRRLCAASLASAASPDAAPGLRLVLASTRTAAWLAALAATDPALPSQSGDTSWRVLLPERVAAFLRPLPVGVLASLPDLRGASGVAEALAALAQSGIGTLGQVARVPATALRRRFGPLGDTLATLAAGQDAMPLRVWRPPAWIGARLWLDPPVAAAQLAPALAPLANHLVARLGQQHRAASTVALVLRLDDGSAVRASRRLSHPAASPTALLNYAHRLLAMVAEREPGSRCSVVHFRVGELRAAAPRQDVLWLGEAARTRRAQRVRLFAPDGPLAGRQGAATLLRAHLVTPDAVLPEERYRLVPLPAA